MRFYNKIKNESDKFSRLLFFNDYLPFFLDQAMITIPIPTAGPKVTSLVWGSLDEKLITGHDNGDIVSWDVKEAQKDKIVSDHTKSITDMQLSADGKFLKSSIKKSTLKKEKKL